MEENNQKSAVSAYNEWDPLEEVIVGVVDGAAVPPWHVCLEATMPTAQFDFFKKFGGKPFPQERIDAANRDLDEFVHILESEGVTVRRPDIMDHSRSYSTPDWQSECGFYAAMPRDLILVIGDEIIETPLAWRSRYFEIHAYRSLIKEYFKKGAKWTTAPKPELADDIYNYDYKPPNDNAHSDEYSITEYEPTFDAADFIRCGRDIFVQKSHVTNEFGINWLKRHLGDTYRIHVIEVNDPGAMHIDATFMPLAPGKLLLHPSRLANLPDMFKSWDILYAPKPCIPDSVPLYVTSKWITMNVIMLDEKRVIVEKHEEPTIKAFKDWGLEPIPCSFRNFNAFGGSFHCATLDIRRKGELQSYF